MTLQILLEMSDFTVDSIYQNPCDPLSGVYVSHILQSQIEYSTLDWLWKNSRHYLEHSTENKVENYLSSHLQEIIPRVHLATCLSLGP